MEGSIFILGKCFFLERNNQLQIMTSWAKLDVCHWSESQQSRETLSRSKRAFLLSVLWLHCWIGPCICFFGIRYSMVMIHGPWPTGRSRSQARINLTYVLSHNSFSSETDMLRFFWDWELLWAWTHLDGSLRHMNISKSVSDFNVG